ncbi:hypothetical protein TNIN_390961 [Trichonephila inaurata madagascariensis]|uniref:Uncharacterized protein n=1 Tax=Trichonephila inaurata madagascariensis TaxID=2747483 RepID=A0A8X6XT73_9ARAC|nr:hypothetical protein TNIN_390961 [Trichonephila inaurata madagascariensis]
MKNHRPVQRAYAVKAAVTFLHPLRSLCLSGVAQDEDLEREAKPVQQVDTTDSSPNNKVITAGAESENGRNPAICLDRIDIPGAKRVANNRSTVRGNGRFSHHLPDESTFRQQGRQRLEQESEMEDLVILPGQNRHSGQQGC